MTYLFDGRLHARTLSPGIRNWLRSEPTNNNTLRKRAESVVEERSQTALAIGQYRFSGLPAGYQQLSQYPSAFLPTDATVKLVGTTSYETQAAAEDGMRPTGSVRRSKSTSCFAGGQPKQIQRWALSASRQRNWSPPRTVFLLPALTGFCLTRGEAAVPGAGVRLTAGPQSVFGQTGAVCTVSQSTRFML